MSNIFTERNFVYSTNSYGVLDNSGACLLGSKTDRADEHYFINFGELTIASVNKTSVVFKFGKEIVVYVMLRSEKFQKVLIDFEGRKFKVDVSDYNLNNYTPPDNTKMNITKETFIKTDFEDLNIVIHGTSIYIGREKDVGVNLTCASTLEFFRPHKGLTKAEFINYRPFYRQTYYMEEGVRPFKKLKCKMQSYSQGKFFAEENFENGFNETWTQKKKRKRENGLIYMAKFHPKFSKPTMVSFDVEDDEEIGHAIQPETLVLDSF